MEVGEVVLEILTLLSRSSHSSNQSVKKSQVNLLLYATNQFRKKWAYQAYVVVTQ